jgi:rhodanese-related sulfurtransferase
MEHSPGFLALVTEARGRVKECGIDDVRARLARGERFHFVDVREDDEFAVDRARGAQHIGRGVIERDIERLIPDKSAPIVLYCGGGFRSALAADNLKKMGYTNVISMDGGMRAWRAAGYEIEAGPGAGGGKG